MASFRTNSSATTSPFPSVTPVPVEQLPLPHPNYLPVGEALQQAGSIFITAHVGPDGDTLGSMLALKWALLNLPSADKRTVHCVISGKMPDVYRFLPGIDEVLDVEQAQAQLLEQYDVAVSVDCGSLERLGPAGAYFAKAKLSINIDHHVSNLCFGQLNLVVPEAAASGEVVAYLLDSMGLPITKPTAEALYVALLTDTGGFRFSATTASVFKLCARLVEAGVEPEPVYKAIYESTPYPQARLHAEAMLRSELALNGKLIWVLVSQADLQRVGAIEEHIEGMIDGLRQVQGVLAAAVIRETKSGEAKVSLRSNHHGLNVAAVLETMGGGGHKMAAGANWSASPQETWTLLQPKLEAAILAITG